MTRCVVLDASALQAGRPGPGSPCSHYDEAKLVACVYALPACVLERCWRLCVPGEALEELRRAVTRVFAAQGGALLSMVMEAGKLFVEHVEPTRDELARVESVAREAGARGTDVYYLVLVLRIAKGRARICSGCTEAVLATCDAGMARALQTLTSDGELRGAAVHAETPVELFEECVSAG